MALPRLLVLIGSGETTRMAAAVYREMLDRFPVQPTVRLLETTYAFQENRAEVTARLIAFLRDHAGLAARPAGADAVSEAARRAAVQADLEDADVVVAGPGSPSYALRRWAETSIPDALAATLAGGGTLVLASAAACTAGAWALPVYELYKAGHDPHWLPGLDLTRMAGLDVAVVPHFDNAEGGSHDTRYCYMGERRLRRLEAQLPPSTALLGVDEHTAAILDLDADTVAVQGRGGVTVRRRGVAVTRVPAGITAPLDELRTAAPHADPRALQGEDRAEEGDTAGVRGTQALAASVRAALHRGDVDDCVATLLELDRRSRDGPSASERAAARAALHAGVARLARAAAARRRDHPEVLAPLVDTVLAVRSEARRSGDYARADALREQLQAAGVEVRDTPDGTVWLSRRSPDGDGANGGCYSSR